MSIATPTVAIRDDEGRHEHEGATVAAAGSGHGAPAKRPRCAGQAAEPQESARL